MFEWAILMHVRTQHRQSELGNYAPSHRRSTTRHLLFLIPLAYGAVERRRQKSTQVQRQLRVDMLPFRG